MRILLHFTPSLLRSLAIPRNFLINLSLGYGQCNVQLGQSCRNLDLEA